MAKMFYTLEEASAKLGKTGDELKQMVAKGQLQEFRDRDRLMFKVEQVDLLAGGEESIPLADSGLDIGLAASGSATGVNVEASSREESEGTGISVFDPEQTDESDPSAVTRMATGPASLADPGKSGSGSRLLDLTKEADDTSLGGGLLEDVYGSETVAQQTAVEGEAPAGDAGGLFETPAAAGGEEYAAAGAGVAMVAAEPFDGPGSGWVGGAAFGMLACAALALFAIITGLAGAAGTGMVSKLVDMAGGNPLFVAGGALGLVALSSLVGWLILRGARG